MPRQRVRPEVGDAEGPHRVIGYTAPDAKRGRSMVLVECIHCGHQPGSMQVGNWKRGKRCLECQGLRKDLTGLRQGKLTVCYHSKTLDQVAYWLCACDCGNTCELRTAAIKSGQQSCGRCSRAKLSDARVARGIILRSYKRGARERSLAWALDDDEAWQLLGRNCCYCDAPPALRHFRTTETRNRTVSHAVNGIDRLNSGRGYFSDNVVPCCSRCNRMKSKFSQRDFLDRVDAIVRHLKLAPRR